MILRRVIAHFRKQEWTAIFLDFVIVVAGVFIGIQVSNWNAARADGVRAHGFLERIRADLGADIANYRNRLDFWRQVYAYGTDGLAYADGGNAKGRSQWDLLVAFFHSSQVAEFFTTDATYEELKSAGELGLIPDLQLRDGLARYYTNAGNPALSERPAYRVHVRGVIPVDVQTYIWDNCYRSNPGGEQFFVACKAPINEEAVSAIIDKIRHDEALMSELRYWMSTMKVASLIGRDRTESAEELRTKVDAALLEGKSKP